MAQVTQPKKGLNITLWILQVVLAAMYLMAGYQKAFGDLDVIVKTIFWVGYTPTPLVRFIGISELLGALGLILPAALKIKPQLTTLAAALKIKPQLTTLAAAGISTIMLLANLLHIYRGEFFVLPMTMVIFAIALFVAYGRWKLAPVASKIKL